jgi:hypothetical protein
MKIFLILIMLISPSLAFCAPPSKQDWFDKTHEKVPELLCKSGEIKDCEKLAKSSVSPCLETYWRLIPAMSDNPKQNSKWKIKILRCTALVMEVLMNQNKDAQTSEAKKNDDIELVKNGTLRFDRSLTLAQALSNYQYFNSVRWENYESKNGRNIVAATCSIDIGKYPYGDVLRKNEVKQYIIGFQFSINVDGGFQLIGSNLKLIYDDGTKKEGEGNALQAMSFIRLIYQNQPID